MSANFVQWGLFVAIVVVFWLLGSILDELRKLSQKMEYWGKIVSGTADEIRAEVNEMSADTSSLHHDVSDIAERASERFPTIKEIEKARDNEP